MAVVSLMRRLQKAPRVLVSALAVGSTEHRPTRRWSPWTKSPHPARASFSLTFVRPLSTRHGAPRPWACAWCACGVVLGHGGGAYPMQVLSARQGLGAVLGHGRQPAPWVHLADAVGLVRFAMAHQTLQGPVNAMAPDAVTQATFAQALAASFGRRAWLRMPGLPLRSMLGEMSTLLLDGQNAVPCAALAHGYRFAHPQLNVALTDLAETQRPESALLTQNISQNRL